MKYDLKRLIRGRGIRRPSIDLPSQPMPLYRDAELAAALLRPVRVWEGRRGELVSAYEAALGAFTKDSPDSDLAAAIMSVNVIGQQAVLEANPFLDAFFRAVNEAHAKRWASLVNSAVGINPWPYIDLNEAGPGIAQFMQRMTSLISDVNEKTRAEVSEVLWDGLVNKRRPREVGKLLAEKMNTSRKRANFIASDQSNKFNAYLTELRQEEAGIDEFVWETAKDGRVRDSHRALQGRVFKWKEPPSVGLPGTPIRCRCTGRAHIDLSS